MNLPNEDNFENGRVLVAVEGSAEAINGAAAGQARRLSYPTSGGARSLVNKRGLSEKD
jgi:hypothetical protein